MERIVECYSCGKMNDHEVVNELMIDGVMTVVDSCFQCYWLSDDDFLAQRKAREDDF